MAYKYDVVHLVTADYKCGDVPASLVDKTFTSFSRAADAICEAAGTSMPHSVTVRRLEDGRLMGFRAVMPDGNGSYSYQRNWALEY